MNIIEAKQCSCCSFLVPEDDPYFSEEEEKSYFRIGDGRQSFLPYSLLGNINFSVDNHTTSEDKARNKNNPVNSSTLDDDVRRKIMDIDTNRAITAIDRSIQIKQERSAPVAANNISAITIVGVVDTHGHPHLERVATSNSSNNEEEMSIYQANTTNTQMTCNTNVDVC